MFHKLKFSYNKKIEIFYYLEGYSMNTEDFIRAVRLSREHYEQFNQETANMAIAMAESARTACDEQLRKTIAESVRTAYDEQLSKAIAESERTACDELLCKAKRSHKVDPFASFQAHEFMFEPLYEGSIYEQLTQAQCEARRAHQKFELIKQQESLLEKRFLQLENQLAKEKQKRKRWINITMVLTLIFAIIFAKLLF